MVDAKFIKGDYNTNHCELWTDDDCFGDVRTEDADKFIDLINGLIEENEQLKQSKDNLYTFFIQWFEDERGINQEEFCEWWNAIQKGKTKFNER